MLGSDAATIARFRASLAQAAYDSTGFKRALGQEGYVPKAGERLYVETVRFVLPAA